MAEDPIMPPESPSPSRDLLSKYPPQEDAGELGYFGRRQQAKERLRWSVSDWMNSDEKVHGSDLWFSFQSPNPLEFYLDAAFRTGLTQLGGYYQGWNFAAAMYAYIFGAEIQYQPASLGGSQDSRWTLLGNVRLLGAYNQATNLTLQLGAKAESQNFGGSYGQVFWNFLMGGTLTLYLKKSFGLLALYRYSFPHYGGIPVAVNRIEGGGFYEFRFLRFYVNYFNEMAQNDGLLAFQGVEFGGRFYF